MTNVDLRKLNRKQLLELLLEQTQRANQLEEQLQLANEKLQNKTMIEKEAGSIADAALQLNGVFEACQQAANQYLENVKQKYGNQEQENARIEEECRKRCELMVQEANNICKQKEEEINEKTRVLNDRIKQLSSLKQELEEILRRENL